MNRRKRRRAQKGRASCAFRAFLRVLRLNLFGADAPAYRAASLIWALAREAGTTGISWSSSGFIQRFRFMAASR